MRVSRKDFFSKGILSLGSVAFDAAALLRREAPVEAEAEADETPEAEGGEEQVAVCRPEFCLSRGGCFSCLESCEVEAIGMVHGRGIEVDPSRCTGCGSCVYVCPTTPKALSMEKKEL